MVAQNALLLEQIHKDCRNRHLQKGFLDGGQSQIPLVLCLAEIIQKTDQAKRQAQCQHIKNSIVLHHRKIANNADNGGEDKEQTTHHRCSRFIIMPCRTDFTDGLSGLECPKNREQQNTQQTGQNATGCHCDQNSRHISIPPLMFRPSGSPPAQAPCASRGCP